MSTCTVFSSRLQIEVTDALELARRRERGVACAVQTLCEPRALDCAQCWLEQIVLACLDMSAVLTKTELQSATQPAASGARKVVVTGGCGFLGAKIVDLLLQKADGASLFAQAEF